MKMNGGRSDASTSTDDVKGRPLCLFYFTHPFGVLSPEPPTVATAPPHITHAFLNMEPVSPFHFWSTSTATDESYNTATSDSSRPDYECTNTTVHHNTVNLVSLTRTKKCTLEYEARRDSASSSLFSSDIWLNSSSSCRSNELGRRLVPYHKILPPLQFPYPKYLTLDSPEDLWPKKCLNPEKFSLPPIELPSPSPDANVMSSTQMSSVVLEDLDTSRYVCDRDNRSGKELKCRRIWGVGVRKQKHLRKPCNVRRAIASLMQRVTKGEHEAGSSPALQEVLNTIREAWPEPTSLFDRLYSLRYTAEAKQEEGMVHRAQLVDLASAPGASPGLMRRRYSVPETIMRKYRLAQQRTGSDDVSLNTQRSPVSASPPRDPSGESPHRFMRRDRELMRKSALLRRMWGRGNQAVSSSLCHCTDALDAEVSCCRETRSLDGSRSELRPLSGGWTHPKRLRLDSGPSAHRLAYSGIESTPDPFTDTDVSKLDEHVESRAIGVSSSTTTSEIRSDFPEEGSARLLNFAPPMSNGVLSFDNQSQTFPTPGSSGNRTDQVGQPQVHPNESLKDLNLNSVSRLVVDDNKDEALPNNTPLSIETPSYEVLEIVVSETQSSSLPITNEGRRPTPMLLKSLPHDQKHKQNINIDEYVSNILVESLNSLSDQLECMNASIGGDRKMSVVEKEIKVKLQNTGVNTIVHLSPTSNNQIIFGNEELCNIQEVRDNCNNVLDKRDSIAIREEPHSVESNNNRTSACSRESYAGKTIVDNTFTNAIQQETVNKAVLHQIQKLFRDELIHNVDQNICYADNGVPVTGISHIEISNVDVYIDNKNEGGQRITDSIELQTCRTDAEEDVIAGVGAGNYYAGNYKAAEHLVVPRFSAFPHTDSMEVNTSSSDDADVASSDCTSLVDSLDDPNSPRSVLLRRSFNGRRSELVRSAIDVLDLLPETASLEENTATKEKGESFFIRIKGNDYDCEKENIKVADHMPEKIKQRLYKRQKKRELRMECARRSRVIQLKRDVEGKRANVRIKSKRETEKECMAIINALIDDVISKIAQEEYTCMRIKKRPTKLAINKIDEFTSKKCRKFDSDSSKSTPTVDVSPLRASSKCPFKSTRSTFKDARKSIRHQIHGKLSLVTRPSPTSDDDRGPKRIYQKSEIHEGNKFIEILEILEYVNGSKSSPETSPSDENQSYHQKNKKSKIPIPVHDKTNKAAKVEPSSNNSKSNNIEQMTATVLRDEEDRANSGELARNIKKDSSEPRSRRHSHSLGFKRSFDVIPEERTSLSVDSSDEEKGHFSHKQMTPALAKENCANKRKEKYVSPLTSPIRGKSDGESAGKGKLRRSIGTSPFLRTEAMDNALNSKSRGTMTSPIAKSASTSPLRLTPRATDDAALRSEGIEESRVNSGALDDRKNALSVGRAGSLSKPNTMKPPQKATANVRKYEQKELVKCQLTEPAACGKHTIRGSCFERPQIRRSEGEWIQEEQLRSCRSGSADRSETVRLPECKGSSSDSGESAGSLFCPLAPKWLSAHARHKRNSRPRRRGVESAPSSPQSISDCNETATKVDSGAADGGWSVTVAGTCRAALPADVQMRLRFPHDVRISRVHDTSGKYQDCSCRPYVACSCSARVEHAARSHGAPPLPPTRRIQPADGKLTLTMKKEALGGKRKGRRFSDSSVLTTRSKKKSTVPLPDVETYAAASTKMRSSLKTTRLWNSLPANIRLCKSLTIFNGLVKEYYLKNYSPRRRLFQTRRGYSLHCWLPDTELTPIRPSKGLSVLGCAIIPELKPRAPTMSERDLTRAYTPRHYLRS